VKPGDRLDKFQAMSRTAVRLIVQGRVQGVGYRWWAVGEARRLGLDGWVRNRADGSVELVAAGTPEELDRLQAACRRGPR
jgi:acylphosphatase